MNPITQSFAPVFLLITLLSGCSGGGDKPAGGDAMPPPEVDVITVAKGNATLTQDLP